MALSTSVGKLDHAPDLCQDKSQYPVYSSLKTLQLSLAIGAKKIKMSSSVLVTVFQQHPKELFKEKQAISRMRKTWHREVS